MKRTALGVKTGLKGGRLAANHSRSGLKVASLKVATGLKGGRLVGNHSRSLL